MKLLEIKDVDIKYGESLICHDLILDVNEGEIVCIMGRNGVGKTTTAKAIMGLVRVSKGEIFFKGKNITSLRPYEVARLGIGYVPQGRMIFPDLTVKENLQGAMFVKGRNAGKISEEIFYWFPFLKERLSQKEGTLSGGEQQQLAIARCLIRDPDLLILDEPSEGIQPNIVQRIGEIIIEINKKKDVTILLIEQNLGLCLSCGIRSYVMDGGTFAMSGDIETVANSPMVHEHLTFKK